jgi:hypothetical protein
VSVPEVVTSMDASSGTRRRMPGEAGPRTYFRSTREPLPSSAATMRPVAGSSSWIE